MALSADQHKLDYLLNKLLFSKLPSMVRQSQWQSKINCALIACFDSEVIETEYKCCLEAIRRFFQIEANQKLIPTFNALIKTIQSTTNTPEALFNLPPKLLMPFMIASAIEANNLVSTSFSLRKLPAKPLELISDEVYKNSLIARMEVTHSYETLSSKKQLENLEAPAPTLRFAATQNQTQSLASCDTLSNQIDHLESLSEKYRDFACSDYRRFRNTIKLGKAGWVEGKEKALRFIQRIQEASINLAAQPDSRTGRYSKKAIKQVAKIIDRAQSACCTTFTLSLANQLLIDNPNTNFQILTYNHGLGSHCFIALNTHTGHELILDPWLASLGWDKGVYTKDNYPWQQYLENTSCVFEANPVVLIQQQSNRTPT